MTSSASSSMPYIKQEPEVDFICILPASDSETDSISEDPGEDEVPESKANPVKGRKLPNNDVKAKDPESKSFACDDCFKVFKTMPKTSAKKARKSYTICFKLLLLDEKQNHPEISWRELARRYKVTETMLRNWKIQETQLRQNIRAGQKKRKIPRNRVGFFPEVDEAVLKWVKERNEQGIQVKDKFIMTQGRKARDELIASESFTCDKDMLKRFQASRLWCQRFKERSGLISPRHTTPCTLPNDSREQSVSYND